MLGSAAQSERVSFALTVSRNVIYAGRKPTNERTGELSVRGTRCARRTQTDTVRRSAVNIQYV